MDKLEEIENKVLNINNKNNAPAKSIGEMNLEDLKFKPNESESFQQQAEDLANAKAIIQAFSDSNTASQLADAKAEELLIKSQSKKKKEQANNIYAEAEKQEAERKLYEAVLETFAIKTHLPQWLMKCLVVIFSPIYIILCIIIGVPCGIIKTLIDNIDNIICRYEKSENTSKPKIKVTIWVLFVLGILGAIALIVLKVLKLI